MDPKRAAAIQRYQAGDKVDDIIKDVGISRNSFYLWLKAEGVPVRQKHTRTHHSDLTKPGVPAGGSLDTMKLVEDELATVVHDVAELRKEVGQLRTELSRLVGTVETLVTVVAGLRK